MARTPASADPDPNWVKVQENKKMLLDEISYSEFKVALSKDNTLTSFEFQEIEDKVLRSDESQLSTLRNLELYAALEYKGRGIYEKLLHALQYEHKEIASKIDHTFVDPSVAVEYVTKMKEEFINRQKRDAVDPAKERFDPNNVNYDIIEEINNTAVMLRNWKTLARKLMYDSIGNKAETIILTIERKHRDEIDQCIPDVIDEWRNTDDSDFGKPKLIRAIRQMGYGRLADKLTTMH